MSVFFSSLLINFELINEPAAVARSPSPPFDEQASDVVPEPAAELEVASTSAAAAPTEQDDLDAISVIIDIEEEEESRRRQQELNVM